MERAEWLQQMQDKLEVLYDHLSPGYCQKFGLYPNEAHREYVQKFLELVPPRSTLLSAARGAGRYDGILLEAGHSVVGIDQSAEMLARAKERFPEARYEKMALQDMDFQEAFDGATCIDAMEHDELYGKQKHFSYLMHGNDHSFPQFAKQLAFAWLDRFLKA